MKRNRIVRNVLCLVALAVTSVVGLRGRRHLRSSLDPQFLSFVEIGDVETVREMAGRRPELTIKEQSYTISFQGVWIAHLSLTPLQMSAYGGHENTTRLLLNAGADPEKYGDSFPPPLHLAARRGYPGVCRILIEHGAEPNTINESKSMTGQWRISPDFDTIPVIIWFMTEGGYTPLHHAAIQGHSAVVDLLLEKGASPDIQDANGNTPLHLALMAETREKKAVYLPVIRSLIIEGASITIRNDRERTPMDEASSRTRAILMDEGWTTGRN